MGTGKRIIVSATGFPGTNKTWRHLQEAFREPLGALAALAGNNVIITGCTVTSGVASPGFISHAGEILYFEGGPIPDGDLSVVVVEETENAEYDVDLNEDGQRDILPAYGTKTIRFSGSGTHIGDLDGFPRLKTIKELSEFTLPANLVIDANYVHTDNNFTDELLIKLLGIAAGAEVNVQADWNVANSASDAFIKNKPVNLMKRVLSATWLPGDVPVAGASMTVNFTTPESNTDYHVVATLETQVNSGDNVHNNTSLQYSIFEKTTTSFKIRLREWANGTQTSLRVRISVFRAI